MRNEYIGILQTPAVERAQVQNYGRSTKLGSLVSAERGLGEAERFYIGERDSFYIASVSESGWPYLQHRGGEAGFLKVVDERRLAYLDLEGNRQMISVGNVSEDDRVSLFLMDYRARERLKVLARARCVALEDEPGIMEFFSDQERSKAKRLFVLDVEGFDWNCPKYITQRFTRGDVNEVILPMSQRIEELETELRKVGAR